MSGVGGEETPEGGGDVCGRDDLISLLEDGVGGGGHGGAICYVMLYSTEVRLDTSSVSVSLCTFPSLDLTGLSSHAISQ